VAQELTLTEPSVHGQRPARRQPIPVHGAICLKCCLGQPGRSSFHKDTAFLYDPILVEDQADKLEGIVLNLEANLCQIIFMEQG
jgi:hypothetical protein